MRFAIESIAPKIGCAPQTLYESLHKCGVDTGMRAGVTSDERERVGIPRREIKELRQANEILKLENAFLPERN